MRRFWTILMVLFLGATLAGCAASKKKGGTVEVEDATIGGSGAEVSTDASASAVGSDDATAGEIITLDQADAFRLDGRNGFVDCIDHWRLANDSIGELGCSNTGNGDSSRCKNRFITIHSRRRVCS